MSKDLLITLVDEAVLKLREHCDTVQIFVTLQQDDKEQTDAYESGKGNFYARQGQVEEWLTIQREYQRSYARRKDDEDRSQ